MFKNVRVVIWTILALVFFGMALMSPNEVPSYKTDIHGDNSVTSFLSGTYTYENEVWFYFGDLSN